MEKQNARWLHEEGLMPDWVFYQLYDDRSPQERYAEQKRKIMDQIQERENFEEPETAIYIVGMK